MKFAEVRQDSKGDHAVYEFSHLRQEFLFVRSFVFKQNADLLAERIERYHNRCDRDAFYHDHEDRGSRAFFGNHDDRGGLIP